MAAAEVAPAPVSPMAPLTTFRGGGGGGGGGGGCGGGGGGGGCGVATGSTFMLAQCCGRASTKTEVPGHPSPTFSA